MSVVVIFLMKKEISWNLNLINEIFLVIDIILKHTSYFIHLCKIFIHRDSQFHELSIPSNYIEPHVNLNLSSLQLIMCL